MLAQALSFTTAGLKGVPRRAALVSPENLLEKKSLGPHPKLLISHEPPREAGCNYIFYMLSIYYREWRIYYKKVASTGVGLVSGRQLRREDQQQAGSPRPGTEQRSVVGVRLSVSLPLCVFLFPIFFLSTSLSLFLALRSKWSFKSFPLIRPGPPTIISLIKIH